MWGGAEKEDLCHKYIYRGGEEDIEEAKGGGAGLGGG